MYPPLQQRDCRGIVHVALERVDLGQPRSCGVQLVLSAAHLPSRHECFEHPRRLRKSPVRLRFMERWQHTCADRVNRAHHFDLRK